jgi:hypothetical protein
MRGAAGPARLWIAVGVAVVAIVVGAIVLTSGGGGPATSPSGSPSVTAEQALASLCAHKEDFQLRYEALGRLSQDLQNDAAALRAAGDEETAAAADELVAAVDAVHTALGDNEDTTDEVAAVLVALDDLPC